MAPWAQPSTALHCAKGCTIDTAAAAVQLTSGWLASEVGQHLKQTPNAYTIIAKHQGKVQKITGNLRSTSFG